jgi:hypothetical protein
MGMRMGRLDASLRGINPPIFPPSSKSITPRGHTGRQNDAEIMQCQIVPGEGKHHCARMGLPHGLYDLR